MPDATSTGSARDRRWLILGVIGQRSWWWSWTSRWWTSRCRRLRGVLHFTTADRQWVVTAYTPASGSLLLLGGRLADLLGRKAHSW